MEKYDTRVSEYPTGSVLDASLALAVSFPFAETSPQDYAPWTGFVNSISFLECAEEREGAPYRQLHLPLLLVKHQSHATELEVATVNEQRMACASAVRFLAALGITEFPVYGLATFGSRGVVSQAWYEASENCCYVVDEDRPEYQFDISDEHDIRRYVEFLGKVEETAARLGAAFEAARSSLLERIQSEGGRASLRWTLQSQLASRGTGH
ncbi:hypothetical protein V8D89_015787 [Ganoderma adspersum]